MKLIQTIYRLLANLKQGTSRLLSVITVCLAAVFALNPSANADILRVDRTNGSCSGDGSGWESDAFKYLQDALGEAVAGDQIWVAATATYYPDEDCAKPGGTDDEALSFDMIAAVAVYGGFAGGETVLEDRDIVANETILSGEIGDPGDKTDNSHSVVSFVDLTGAPAVLDGFIVRDGHDGSGSGVGGGAYVVSTEDAIIRNCVFQENFAGTGGGIGITHGAGDELEVRNCRFEDNDAVDGGGIGSKSVTDSDVNVINCYFSANEASLAGGGVYCLTSRMTFINATFTENIADTPMGSFGDGGAAYFAGGAEGLIINSLFLYNIANDDGS